MKEKTKTKEEQRELLENIGENILEGEKRSNKIKEFSIHGNVTETIGARQIVNEVEIKRKGHRERRRKEGKRN